MRWLALGLFLPAVAFANEKTMTMSWDHADRADGYIVKRGGCDGEIAYQGPENLYIEKITGDVTYCLYAFNDFGESDPVVKTAWYDAARPGKITVTITVEIQ